MNPSDLELQEYLSAAIGAKLMAGFTPESLNRIFERGDLPVSVSLETIEMSSDTFDRIRARYPLIVAAFNLMSETPPVSAARGEFTFTRALAIADKHLAHNPLAFLEMIQAYGGITDEVRSQLLRDYRNTPLKLTRRETTPPMPIPSREPVRAAPAEIPGVDRVPLENSDADLQRRALRANFRDALSE